MVIESGRLEVMRYHPETGRLLTIDLLGPGDTFDLPTLLDGELHDVITRAADPIGAMTVSVDTMRGWIQLYPAIEHALLRMVARQLRRMEDLAADIALFDTPTRLSNLILRYAQPDPACPAGRPRYLLRGMSHEMLARMIGTVRAVANRCLQELKAQGVVRLRRNEIQINDLDAIRARSDHFLKTAAPAASSREIT